MRMLSKSICSACQDCPAGTKNQHVTDQFSIKVNEMENACILL